MSATIAVKMYKLKVHLSTWINIRSMMFSQKSNLQNDNSITPFI